LVLNVQTEIMSSGSRCKSTVIRLAFQLKFVAGVLLLLVGTAGISRAEQADQVPAKELVQYIRDAQKQGIAEVKIKQQALAVGWASAAVDAALEYAKSGQSVPANPAAQAVSNPPEEATIAARPTTVPEKTAATMPGNPVPHGSSDDYLIGSGDTLQIAIWKEPEASVPSVVVRPDGRITIPLIKEVEVAGLTPRQVEVTITAGMGKFINDPNVTVVVAAINSKKVYMIGAVKKEGTLPYTYGMTVMQALSEAGGLTDYAKRKKIYILRSEKGREYRLDFNYEEVIKGERMDQNAVLLPGDTVVIPQ
jgi:polysaccharide biosynthesis/export protein